MVRPSIIDLRELAETVLPKTALSAAQAVAIVSAARILVDVSWPTPANAFQWSLRPRGWVGTFPIDADLVLRIAPKIPVPRIFELARLAGGGAGIRILDGLAPTATTLDALEEVLRLLARLVGDRIARGLRKDYVANVRSGQTPRGRIRLLDTTLGFATGRATLTWDERSLTTDVDDNRILAFTLSLASRLPLDDRPLAAQLAHLGRYLATLTSHRNYGADDCRSRDYARADGDYGILHALCALVLEGVGPTAAAGPSRFPHFGFDMPAIFERSVAVLLATRLDPGYRLRAKPSLSLGGGIRFVPDLVVEDGEGSPVAVLDTKYKPALHEGDVQQVVAYATALGASRAILVHPVKVGRGPIVAGGVSVRTMTFDLSLPPLVAAELLADDFRRACGSLGRTERSAASPASS